MNVKSKYKPFIASALLLSVLLCIIYPYYHYYVDPDGTAYLTISKRYAAGDYAKAINGYWSPWACWLTALLIKTGLNAIPASVIINALGSLGLMFVSHSIAIKLKVNSSFQWIICTTLALFLCFAIFYQSFDDLWECFFLLSALRIMIFDNFTIRPGLWFITGLFGTLSYFSKSYAFPFFILNIICCVYFISDRNIKTWLKVSAITILTMLVFSAPWIWLLHHKYGIWTTSTAGALNTSWYLVGHPFWKPGYRSLLPPVYNDSPYYWEDPYFANGATPHFWDSPALAWRQVLRVGQNVWKLLVSMVQLSIFFPIITFMLGRFVFNSKATTTTAPAFIVALSFLLFPIGYLLVNFEQRYIWYMVPISMIAGVLFFQNHIKEKLSKGVFNTILVAFALSYLVYPAYWLKTHFNDGLSEYNLATRLKNNNITGPFCSNALPGLGTQKMVRLAYFSGNPYYVEPLDRSVPLDDIKKFHVQYYFCNNVDSNIINRMLYSLVYKDTISHIDVYKLIQ